MKIDNREFIARHHKTASPQVPGAARKHDYGRAMAALTLMIFVGMLVFLATLGTLHETTRIITGVIFVLAGIGGFMAFRSYRAHARKEGEITLMQSVLEGSRAARMITDGADNLVYHNQKFERLCRGVGPPGYKTLVRLFQNNEEAFSHFNHLADKAHRGLTDSIELFSKYEDRERWLMVTAQPLSGYAGHVHWRIDDVTQKYTLDRAIREEREKLIDFTDNAPVGFFSVNEEGRFVFANATFARWVGEDLRTLLEQGRLHTYLSDPPKNALPYDLVDKSTPRQVVEIYMKGAAGKTFLAAVNQTVVRDADGTVRTRAVVHDLTAEREMRIALKESEARFQKFFEEAPLGIILVDDKGLIADCNAAFAFMLKAPIEKIEGKHFETLIAEENRDSVLSAMAQIEKGHRLQAPLEVALKGEKGTVETQMHARRFKESGNTVLHFIDVTEQRELEAQFVQSQKMQAIGQLAGGVAHDFNNLLTAIIGFCDLLLLRHKPGDPSFADIMQIKQNSNRAANLVRQLLAFSRQQTLQPKVQDVTDILTELSHLLRRLIGANIDLDLVHGQELGLVKVDEGQMEQVMINLAVNARDAIGGSGALKIETENFSNKMPKELVSEELPAGHWVAIKVSDTGCGIPKENLARIFEPFFTTKEVGHGTGLGLATVYGIIRQTGGYLDVQSTVGEGTSFFIYLPRVSEAEAEEAEEENVPEEDDNTKDLTGTERILLVEDEDAVRMFSQRALGNKGYEVLTAESGESALEVIRRLENKHLDLLVTDVVMPNMDGPTLAQRVRQDNPNLKIIFISGYTEDKLKDYMGPNTWFLPKPFTLKQLAAKVKDALED
jgi:two-component system cell cycle sensor histidine kinase/response regulator CckA